MRQKIIGYQEKNHLQWNRFTITGILLIVICGIKVTWGLDRYMDVLFWDESLYLTRGVAMFEQIPKTWGPSYSLWYKCWSFLVQDKVELYYFNFKLTTILISIAFFLLLLSSGVQRVLAFILSLFFLSTYVNLPLWPRVSHFCVIMVIAGIIMARYQKSLVSKLAVCSLALMICAYARPELFLPFLITLLMTYVCFVLNYRNNTRREYAFMALLTIVSVFIYTFFKTPFNNGDASRGIGVFLQHFAMNYSQWNHLDNVFWLDFADIIKQNFPVTTSIKGFIQSNPEAFRHHILSNIATYGIEMGKIIISFFAPIFTKDLHLLCLMVGSMLFVIYFSFTRTYKDKRTRFLGLVKNNLVSLFVLVVFAFPSVVVSVYAYPRQHYLLLQVPILILLVGLILSSISVEIEKSVQKIVVIATVWFFVTPTSEDFTYFNMFRKEDSLCNQKTVRHIQKSFPAKDTFRVFDMEGYMTNLLPANFVSYNHLYLMNKDSIVLSDFIKKYDFDIIYKTPTLTKLNRVQTDTVLFDLIKNPEKYGYFEQKTGNFTPALLIKHRL